MKITLNKAFKSDSQRLAVSLRSSIAKRRSHLNAALCLRGKIVRKRDDKVSFYSKVHEEYVLLHQTGNTKALTRLFRTALDTYEQHYIYSLLCNDEYGVCKL